MSTTKKQTGRTNALAALKANEQADQQPTTSAASLANRLTAARRPVPTETAPMPATAEASADVEPQPEKPTAATSSDTPVPAVKSKPAKVEPGVDMGEDSALPMFGTEPLDDETRDVLSVRVRRTVLDRFKRELAERRLARRSPSTQGDCVEQAIVAWLDAAASANRKGKGRKAA